MSQHIGRAIKKNEIIHHINGDRKDNRIENLYLCPNHSEHGRVHGSFDKLRKQLLDMNIIVFKEGRYVIKIP